MARPPRLVFAGAVYHVLLRGNNRETLFREQADFRRFLDFLREYKESFRFLIYAYALMPNHVHLMIETPLANITKLMQCLNTRYTIYINRKYQRVGHLFQGRFKSFLVDKDSYALELSRYIHLNPVRAGLVDRPSRYPWSSFGTYVGRLQDSLTDIHWLLQQFGSRLSRARVNYQLFVEQVNASEVRNIFDEVEEQTFLGDSDFIHQVKRQLPKAVADSWLGSRRIDAERVLDLVCQAFQIQEDRLLEPRVRSLTRTRAMAMRLLRDYAGLGLSSIGRRFHVSHTAVSLALKTLAKGLHEDPKLKRRLKRLVDKLTK